MTQTNAVITSLAIVLSLVVVLVIVFACTANSTEADSSMEVLEVSNAAALAATAASPQTENWDDPNTVTQAIYQMLKDMHEILGQHGIKYVLSSGTLLGAVRHGGMIPHDDDADIEIFERDEETMKKVVFPQLRKLGYTIILMWFGYKMYPTNGKAIPGYDHKYPALDLFFMHFANGKSRVGRTRSWDHCYFDESTFEDLRPYTFGPLQLYGPANPYTYLNSCYGADWNTTSDRWWDHATESTIVSSKKAMRPGDYLPRVPKYALKDRVAL